MPGHEQRACIRAHKRRFDRRHGPGERASRRGIDVWILVAPVEIAERHHVGLIPACHEVERGVRRGDVQHVQAVTVQVQRQPVRRRDDRPGTREHLVGIRVAAEHRGVTAGPVPQALVPDQNGTALRGDRVAAGVVDVAVRVDQELEVTRRDPRDGLEQVRRPAREATVDQHDAVGP